MNEPTFTRVMRAPFAEVSVYANVSGVESMPSQTGRLFQPTHVEIDFTYDFTAARWVQRTSVTGHYVTDTGEKGAGTGREFLRNSTEDMPRWLLDFIRSQCPAAVMPDLKRQHA